MSAHSDKKSNAITWILSVMGRRLHLVVLLTLFEVYLAGATVLSALLIKNIINAAVDGNRPLFIRNIVYLGILIVSQIVVQAFRRYSQELCKAVCENTFKSRLFKMLTSKDFAHVQSVHSAEWMNRLTSDTVVVAEGISEIIPTVTGMLVQLIGALSLIVVLVPAVSWLLIPGGVGLMLFTTLFRKTTKRLHKLIQEKDGKLRIYLTERLGSLLIVKSFLKENDAVSHAEVLMEDHKDARMTRMRFITICNIGFSVVMRGAYFLGVLYCGYGILIKTVSYGIFAAVTQLVGQVQSPLANITGYVPKFFSMTASAERLMSAEEYPDDNPVSDDTGNTDDACHRTPEEVRALYNKGFEGLALRDVSFTYMPRDEQKREPVVVEHFNLSVKKGEFVALTGPSGSGKSTLLKLIMAFYPLGSGERVITVNGEDLALTPTYRALFAYVPQGNQLMSGTIREVVSFGDKKLMAQDDVIRHALRIACADFVDELPAGLDTSLGEHGAGLSEGQIQRLAIARAIASGQPILVLDEATSSLDMDNEKRLLENIRGMTDKTVIIVTHRPAALAVCDREVNVADGDR